MLGHERYPDAFESMVLERGAGLPREWIVEWDVEWDRGGLSG